MSPRWFIFGTMLATIASSALRPVSAQESFLDEFRSVNSSRPDQPSVRRPDFLSSLSSKSGADSISEDDADLSDFQPDTLDEQNDSAVHSVSREIEEHCAEAHCHEADCEEVLDCEAPLVRFRNGCYQGSQLNYGYVHDDPNSGLAIRTLDTYATFAVPLGSMENVITFTPFFRADMLNAAPTLDVPDTLYETGVKAFWRRPINERFSSMFLLTPSVRSDFTTSDRAFRLFGMALLTWQSIPGKLAVSGGVVYTGRQDFPVLPAMGLLWTPTPEWKFDVQFPAPRLSRRIAKDGASSETWAYLSGVFGGNTWAVTRAGGAVDELTIRDLRLVTGIEHLMAGNRGIFLETGYVFDRSLEYTVVPLTQELDSTWMVRTGISF